MKPLIYVGETLFRYGFPPPHPLTPERYRLFWDAVKRISKQGDDIDIREPPKLGESILRRFHEEEYIALVKSKSRDGVGFLDFGDTPAYKGMFEVALESVYATLDGVSSTLDGGVAINLAGGWHHAYPSRASGFCIFNDIGVAINSIRDKVDRILYIDIDAHHGDGVYYPFEDDPSIYIFDVHQDPSTLFPGTGYPWERGKGDAEGTKINICLSPGSGGELLIKSMERCVKWADEVEPDYVIVQAGLDGLRGDPLTGLEYTVESHLRSLSMVVKWCRSNGVGLILLGGGGYQPSLFSIYWIGVVENLLLVD